MSAPESGVDELDFDADREGRLLRARVVAALALASAGIPLVHSAISVAREAGVRALGGVAGGWLALALIIYLPLYFGRTTWPLRCSLGTSLWAGAGLAYGAVDLIVFVAKVWIWSGVCVFFVPTLGALLYRWVDAREGYQLSSLPSGLAVGGLMGVGFCLLSVLLVIGVSGLVSLVTSERLAAGVVDVFLEGTMFSAALLGLEIGISFGLAKDGLGATSE